MLIEILGFKINTIVRATVVFYSLSVYYLDTVSNISLFVIDQAIYK